MDELSGERFHVAAVRRSFTLQRLFPLPVVEVLTWCSLSSCQMSTSVPQDPRLQPERLQPASHWLLSQKAALALPPWLHHPSIEPPSVT